MSNALGSVKWSQPVIKGVIPTIKNHTVTAHNGMLYCFGGYDGHINHMSLMVYNVEKQQWTKVLREGELEDDVEIMSSMRSSSNNNNNHNRSGTQQRSSGNNYNSYRFGENDRSAIGRSHDYITMIGNPPSGRNGHSATLVKRKSDGNDEEEEEEERICIFIIGGWMGSGPYAADDLHILDITNSEEFIWVSAREAHGNKPGPCNMHSADFISSKNEIYVFRGGNGCEYLNELFALNVNDLCWRRVQTKGEVPQQRANHSSVFLEETSQLIIFGGWNGKERLNDIHILDTITSTWSRPDVHGNLPNPRAGMSLTALRGKLYLFGGSGTSSKCYQDLHILDPLEMTWLEVVQNEVGRQENSISSAKNNLKLFDKVSGINDPHLVEDWRSQELMDRQNIIGHNPTSTMRDEFLYSSTKAIAANPNEIENEPCISIKGIGPGRRAGHTATAVDRFIYVFGGSCGSDYLDDFFVLDTDPTEIPQVTKPTSQQLVGRRLKYLCNNEEFSDVVFLVDGQRIYAHKMILALASDFYAAMFSASNGFKETSSGRIEIDIPNCSFDTFLYIMQYIYAGNDPKIDTAPIEEVVDILQMADQLLLDHLKQRCEKILQPRVDEDTVDFLLQISHKTNATQLMRVCDHFIRNHVVE